jgi:hypothetical protein
MNKNLVLKFTSVVFKISRILIALLFAFLLIIGIGAFINDDFGSGTIIRSGGMEFNSPENVEEGLSSFAKSNPVQFVFVILQNMAILVVLFNFFGSLLKIVRSINSLKTFAEGNIKAFKNVSVYAFTIFCLKLIEILPGKISFAIHFEPIVVAAFAFILAEVFKEGHQLLKDNELTV